MKKINTFLGKLVKTFTLILFVCLTTYSISYAQCSATIGTNNVTCFGANDGSAEIISISGTPPFTFLWSNGSTNSIISGLSAGVYTCTVTDSTGCFDMVLTSVTEPPPLSSNITTNDPTSFCVGGSALLESTFNPSYSYQWLRYGNPISGANSNNLNVASNGNYKLSITDSSGCMAESNTISIIKYQRPDASIFAAGSNVICDGDSVNLYINNTPGYTYQWYKGGSMRPGATDTCYAAFQNGNHKIRVTNQDGCHRTSNKITIIKQSPTVSVTPPGPIVSVCIGDTVTLIASAAGGTPGYTYQWLRWGLPVPGATLMSYKSIVNPSANNVRGGYRVEVTDANGCTEKSKPNVKIVEVCRIGNFEEELEFDINVYPNPFKDYLSFELSTSMDEPVQISISDITGRLVLKELINVKQTINPLYLQELETGVYLLNAVQGDKVISKKIIKTN